MSNSSKDTTVVAFPATEKKSKASHERIWGKKVLAHGYTGVPSILIQSQARLGLNSMQLNIILQLSDYWFDPERKPFPSKQDLADRIGCSPKTIQNNIRDLEGAGLVRREIRRKSVGDFNSNIYHLDGLVEKIQAIEPDFAHAKAAKKAAKNWAETPKGKRGPAPKINAGNKA